MPRLAAWNVEWQRLVDRLKEKNKVQRREIRSLKSQLAASLNLLETLHEQFDQLKKDADENINMCQENIRRENQVSDSDSDEN